MKVLIIGAAGFVGFHLIDYIKNEYDWEVLASRLKSGEIHPKADKLYEIDVLDKASISSVLEMEQPDYIIHLAAQSSVALSWKNPGLTIDVNIKGCINLLDAIRERGDYQPRILLIGSGEEYGQITPEETPIKESNVLRPGNIYAATKACQGMIGSIYANAYNMDIMMVRAFNHIGPRQTPNFVVADFCKQVAEIEKGLQESKIYVGNLSAKRDFTDVRDVVRAYTLIIQKGQQGELYNVASGKAIAVQEILEIILSLSKSKIEIVVDEKKLRPVDIPEIAADASKINTLLGWLPTIKIEKTIEETLEYWRSL